MYSEFQTWLSDRYGVPIGTLEAAVMTVHDLVVSRYAAFKEDFSLIHGRGCFAAKPLKQGELVGYAMHSMARTPLGRFCNHSLDYNVIFAIHGEDVVVIAMRDIEEDEELVSNYYHNVLLSEQL